MSRLNRLVPKPVGAVIVFVTIAALVASWFASGLEAHSAVLPLPAVAVAFGFLLAESFPIHILYRREATSLSLLEVPMIFGIMALSGLELLLAMVAGVFAALTIVRRQPLVKVLFNLPNLLLQTSITALLFAALASPDGLGLLVLVAAVVAALVGSVLASSLIALVIRVSEGALDPRKTLTMLWFSAMVGLTNASLAMIAMKLAATDRWAVVLLAVPLLVATAAYRAFVSERHQRERLQFLYSATRSLTSDLGESGAVEVLLNETSDMFRASRVELVLFEKADAVDNSVICSTNVAGVRVRDLDPEAVAMMRSIADSLESAELVTASAEGGPLQRWLHSLSIRTALVTALRSDEHDLGVFVVADRVGAVAAFGGADVELFSTLGFQVSTALENDRLGQALGQLKELESELSHLASHDLLTGLPNRLGLRGHLEQLVVDSRGTELLFIDLDDFKLVNDTLGHSSGDQLLVEVSKRILGCLGPDDFVARLGGDEFAVCVATAQMGVSIANRIVDVVRQPLTFEGTDLSVGCSIGIATCRTPTEVTTMLRRADVAMYAAKSAGKNCVRMYTEKLGDELVERQRLRNEIRSAVSDGSLCVHFQPVYALSGPGGPVGAEALVRWDSADGLQPAASFLSVAEESGFVTEIDRWVFRSVMESHAQLADLDWVSVNLSARHLQEEDVVSWLVDTASQHGVDPSTIVLEITETATMNDVEAGITKLEALRAAGFGIALDDFGTGYSSIAYLRRLPITILKVAQPFVSDLQNSGDPTFVRAMIDLAHTLSLPVIAEGVETLEQLTSLRAMGCDQVQGHLLGRAAPLAKLSTGTQIAYFGEAETVRV